MDEVEHHNFTDFSIKKVMAQGSSVHIYYMQGTVGLLEKRDVEALAKHYGLIQGEDSAYDTGWEEGMKNGVKIGREEVLEELL